MKIFLLILLTLSNLFAQSYKIEDIQFPPYIAPEVGGLDFTKEGEIVVALRRHGILIAKPVGDPKAFLWRVFAEDSLNEMCGLQVINKNEMIISQMAELTRIKDTDGDGIADLYETISDDWGISGNYHETNALVPDGKGGWYIAVGTASFNGPNFYHTRGEFKLNGRRGRNFAAVPWKGWVLHVDKDGKTTPFAKGFRANNGISLSPDGKMFVTDNQGDWRGTSPVYHVEKDKFYGHPSSLVWDSKFVKETDDNPLFYYINNPEKYQKDRTPAAIELPQGFMCSSPSQIIWDTQGNFGPFKGQAFVGDVAGGRIIRLMFEEVNGVMQGACVLFVDKELRAGNNRLIFSPDGKSLYTGQTVRGWGKNSEGLQRITYNEKIPFDVLNMSLQKDGFKVTFTKPLNANDKENLANQLSMNTYSYKSTFAYGSSQNNSAKVKISEINLSEDGLSLTFKTESLKVGAIYELNIGNTLKSSTGEAIGQKKICYTLNQLR